MCTCTCRSSMQHQGLVGWQVNTERRNISRIVLNLRLPGYHERKTLVADLF